MRRFLLSVLLLLSSAVASLAETPGSPPVQGPAAEPLAHKRVLVLGDSITQDGRYVTFLEYYLDRLSPGAKCDLISIGLSSETVSGLSEATEAVRRPCVLERLDRALLAVKPQFVLACYGMNDGTYRPTNPEILAAFNGGLHQLIAKVRAAGAILVLVTPPIFDPLPIRARTVEARDGAFGYAHPFAGYDGALGELGAAELGLREAGVSVIDLHTPMAEALAAHRRRDPAFTFSPDGVHPGELGHLTMARIIGTGLGLPLPTGEPEAELARIQADPLFALVSERRRLRSEAWLPFVGYTRGETYKSAEVGAAEQVVARLQREIEVLATTPAAAVKR